MKNTKDKSIIKLLLVFLAYYLISFYMPYLLKGYSKLVNMIVKDFIMIIVVILIYFKDVSKDFRSFKRLHNKWTIILWAIGLIGVFYLAVFLATKYFSGVFQITADPNNLGIEKYYKISKIYAFFKTVVFTGIVEVILFSLSFRKVFNNNIVFIIVSSLVYTYFNYLFTGINANYLLNPLIIRFVPYAFLNYSYIKNSNNIVYTMGVMIVRNLITFIYLLLG